MPHGIHAACAHASVKSANEGSAYSPRLELWSARARAPVLIEFITDPLITSALSLSLPLPMSLWQLTDPPARVRPAHGRPRAWRRQRGVLGRHRQRRSRVAAAGGVPHEVGPAAQARKGCL